MKKSSCYRRRAILSVAWVNCAVAQPLLSVFCQGKDWKNSTKENKIRKSQHLSNSYNRMGCFSAKISVNRRVRKDLSIVEKSTDPAGFWWGDGVVETVVPAAETTTAVPTGGQKAGLAGSRDGTGPISRGRSSSILAI